MNERLAGVLRNPKFVPVAVGGVSFGAGVAVGYFASKRFKTIKVEVPTVVELEVEDSKHIAEEIEKLAVVSETHIVPIIDDDDEPLVTGPAFAETTDEWNLEEELKKRQPNQPYVIHRDEFFENELDYPQFTVTFYEGDGICAMDIQDSPMYNYADILGELKFGHGSGDDNVVYIRNDKRRHDYEVLRHPGLYSQEVLGIEIQDNQRVLKHSKHIPRFRQE